MKYMSLDLNEISSLSPYHPCRYPVFTVLFHTSTGQLNPYTDLVIGRTTDESWFDSRKGKGTSLLQNSRPALWHSKSIIQRLLGALSATGQQPGYEDHHSPPFGAEAKITYVLIREKKQHYLLRYLYSSAKKVELDRLQINFHVS
jgi:hypothetical protein